jgi:hypothetical protein
MFAGFYFTGWGPKNDKGQIFNFNLIGSVPDKNNVSNRIADEND